MQTATSPSYRRDLGDGLVLRWSTAEDTEHIAELVSMVFRDKANDPPNAFALQQIRALMSGQHPMMGPGDYGLIEDTNKEGNPVVACTALWRHTWTYEGIPFSVGRPEMVGTDDRYRNRGLIRALFEMVHERSEAEGDLVQGITGIPYFYRQFGYEFALDLEDSRRVPTSLIPKAKEGELEAFTLREATTDDITEITALYNRRRHESIVSESISRQQWLYEIETWKELPSQLRLLALHMIVDATGQSVGFVAPLTKRFSARLPVFLFELAEGVNWQAVMPPILRALHAYGLTVETVKPDAPAFNEFSFPLGRTHPLFEMLGDDLALKAEPPYAWYVRVKDVPGFLKHIAPVLEKRLVASPVAGYTGEIKLDFYRSGLRMVFEQGRLTTVEPWRVPLYESGAKGGFPPLVFLQLLFGHRSIEELRHMFPDVWVESDARPVLKALFPTRPSFVMGW